MSPRDGEEKKKTERGGEEGSWSTDPHDYHWYKRVKYVLHYSTILSNLKLERWLRVENLIMFFRRYFLMKDSSSKTAGKHRGSRENLDRSCGWKARQKIHETINHDTIVYLTLRLDLMGVVTRGIKLQDGKENSCLTNAHEEEQWSQNLFLQRAL